MPVDPPDRASDRERAIRAEELRRFVAQAAFNHLALSPVGAVIVCALLWQFVPPARVLAWLAVFACGLAVHGLALLATHRRIERGERPVWTWWQAVHTGLLGVSYGSVALIAFPEADEPAAQVFVLVVICAASGAAAISCAPERWAFPANAAGMWTLPVIAFATSGLELGPPLALASVVYVVILLGTFGMAHRTVEAMIRFRYDAEAANAEVRRLALVDDLTGLANRRHLFAPLDEALRRGEAEGARPSLALLDLDRFKAVNDVHGHLAGDDALRHVAATVVAAVGDAGTVARFGGEELAILLPATPVVSAAACAEEVRRAVAATPPAALPDSALTVSIGVAEAAPGDDGAALIGAADAALYAAKRAGRDRVVVGGAAAAA